METVKKRKIDIDVAVKDIRSGMSDAALMAKYRLTAKGLQSLFAKLVQEEVITLAELDERMPAFMGTFFIDETGTSIRRGSHAPVSVEEVLKDIRSGAADPDLMDKYGLTAAGLQSLFDSLMFAELITEGELEDRMPTHDSTVDVRGLINRLGIQKPIKPADPVITEGWECPACGRRQTKPVEECPSCGIIVAKIKKKK